MSNDPILSDDVFRLVIQNLPSPGAVDAVAKTCKKWEKEIQGLLKMDYAFAPPYKDLLKAKKHFLEMKAQEATYDKQIMILVGHTMKLNKVAKMLGSGDLSKKWDKLDTDEIQIKCIDLIKPVHEDLFNLITSVKNLQIATKKMRTLMKEVINADPKKENEEASRLLAEFKKHKAFEQAQKELINKLIASYNNFAKSCIYMINIPAIGLL